MKKAMLQAKTLIHFEPKSSTTQELDNEGVGVVGVVGCTGAFGLRSTGNVFCGVVDAKLGSGPHSKFAAGLGLVDDFLNWTGFAWYLLFVVRRLVPAP